MKTKNILKVILGVFLLVNLTLFSILVYPTPEPLSELKVTESLKITDRHGTLIYESIGSNLGRQTKLSLNQIPKSTIDAFIAVEDQRFYEHSGVDLKAILRAIWQNTNAGEVISGGSTITQQVVRNLIGINKKRTFSQKIKESIFALKISKLHSKEKVLETYLNTIYFGGLAYGIEAASWQYFNKSAINLDLAESAFLAGLPQAPNRYYPFKNFEKAKKRQENVLTAMETTGYISAEEKALAEAETLNLKPESKEKKAPHFVDYILSKNEGQNSTEIKTTLDLGLQDEIQKLITSDVSFLTHLNIQNAAAVILDAKTGDILAMIGSSDYFNKSQQGEVNVTTSLRQPGSSIKPLIYAEAIEKGWSAQTIIEDEPISFNTADGLPYSPKNFDLTYHGSVTLAEALAQSLNIPAVKALDYVSIETQLKRMPYYGIQSLKEEPSYYGLSLALGSGEVTLLELTNAYSSFANLGSRPHIRWLKKQPYHQTKVIQPETAKIVSGILSDNYLRTPAFGEESALSLPFKVAAKTGTTRGFKDNWTIGYTDDYVVGVWVGNANGEVMQGVSGISGAGPIFYKIMNLLHSKNRTQLTQYNNITIKDADSKKPIATPDNQSNEEFRIKSPFANDVFLFDPSKPAQFQKIRLEATHTAKWFIDGQFLSEGSEVLWPITKGSHQIKAQYKNEERLVKIIVK